MLKMLKMRKLMISISNVGMKQVVQDGPLWIRFVALYVSLHAFVIEHEHLRNHTLKLSEHVAYIIWLLGCWYWSSESTIFLWTRLHFLHASLMFLISDRARRLKFQYYIVLYNICTPILVLDSKEQNSFLDQIGFSLPYFIYACLPSPGDTASPAAWQVLLCLSCNAFDSPLYCQRYFQLGLAWYYCVSFFLFFF